LKVIDIMNRHSCFLLNSQNIDYQSLDLLEKFVDFASYFVASFYILIELSCISCSKIRVFHDATTSNDIFSILIDVSIHFFTFFSLSNFWSFMSRRKKIVDMYELDFKFFARILINLSIMNVNTLSMYRRWKIFSLIMLITSFTTNNSFIIRKHATFTRFFRRKKSILLQIITFMIITKI
jgi:hypothetical protein